MQKHTCPNISTFRLLAIDSVEFLYFCSQYTQDGLKLGESSVVLYTSNGLTCIAIILLHTV